MRLFAGFVLLASSLASGCYSPNVTNGALACGANGSCPAGFQCFPDQRCYKEGSSPDCTPVCSGATPACDKTTLKCVGCLADADCPAGLLCALASKTCKAGCSRAHSACPADAGLCDVDAGVCRGCSGDDECSADVANPRCDKDSGLCVPCLPTNDNCPADQRCSGGSGSFIC